MRNMKISKKLLVSFAVVLALIIIVGVFGVYGVTTLKIADKNMYDNNLVSINLLSKIQAEFMSQRVYLRNIVIYDSESSTFTSSVSSLTASDTAFKDLVSKYTDTISLNEEKTNIEKVTTLYGEFNALKKPTVDAGTINDFETARDGLDKLTSLGLQIQTLLDSSRTLNEKQAEIAVTDNASLASLTTIIAVSLNVAAALLAVFIAMYLNSLIAKPMSVMSRSMKQLTATGNLHIEGDEQRSIQRLAQTRDEVGEALGAFNDLLSMLIGKSETLEIISGGDLTATVAHSSENDTMGNSIQKIVDSLNDMLGEINLSTSQVSTGSKQIADGAQMLAQGSTEQAAAVEQLSSSISEIAQKTKTNAEMAEKAASLAGTIKQNAEKGSRQMDQMMEAVKEINQASQSINKVIKVIDDIAFQTNILALNAAVEAARAGQHGKGFAVVAEEVRSLAAKSADAAKDTGGLIANSMEKAQLGAKIAEETAASLMEIVSGINESNQIVSEIAVSSEEQSLGISQINKGIDQVAQVIQQNSATAEESAAASEEMSGQSNMLEELVSQFTLKQGNGARHSSQSGSSRAKKSLAMPPRGDFRIAADEDGFGKY